MRRRLITNLILLIVVAAGAGLIYFEPWAEPPKKEPRLAQISPDKVKRVEIARTGENAQTVVLKRGDGNAWQLVEPFSMRADAAQVKTLLSGLRQRSNDHFPVADRDLAQFGLKSPSDEITAAGTTVAIGDKVPTERTLYAQVGDTIYTVDTGLMRKVDQDPTAFVSRNLLPADTEITAIDGGSFKVVRGEEDTSEWKVARKSGPTADDAGSVLARAWQGAVADSVERRQETGGLTVDVRVHAKGLDTPYQFARLDKGKDSKATVTRPGLPVRYVVSTGLADRMFRLQPPKKSDTSKGKQQKRDVSGMSTDKS